MPCRSSDLAVNAVIEAGTHSRFSDRFSAVTMISVKLVSSAAASAALAGAACRIATTARVSADAPHELALIRAARSRCDRISALYLEDMLFPLARLIPTIPGGRIPLLRILSLRKPWHKHHALRDI